MISEASDSVSLSDRIPVPVAKPQNKVERKQSNYELGKFWKESIFGHLLQAASR